MYDHGGVKKHTSIGKDNDVSVWIVNRLCSFQLLCFLIKTEYVITVMINIHEGSRVSYPGATGQPFSPGPGPGPWGCWSVAGTETQRPPSAGKLAAWAAGRPPPAPAPWSWSAPTPWLPTTQQTHRIYLWLLHLRTEGKDRFGNGNHN